MWGTDKYLRDRLAQSLQLTGPMHAPLFFFFFLRKELKDFERNAFIIFQDLSSRGRWGWGVKMGGCVGRSIDVRACVYVPIDAVLIVLPTELSSRNSYAFPYPEQPGPKAK